MTCAALDDGHKPAVVTAIMKSQATERMRVSVNDAMDVHGGKAHHGGTASNYLGSLYRAVPIGITVEGANIVTRSLIQFGQGAIRCHPYLLKEMLALEDADHARGLDAFDRAFWGHVGHAIANALRAFGRSWTGGLVRAGAGRRQGDAVLPAARPLCRRLRVGGRYVAAHAGRRPQAQGNDLGALRRHSLRALSVSRRRSSAGTTKAGRTTTSRWSNGAWRRASPPSTRASTRFSPISRSGRWPGCCASSFSRSARAGAVRPTASRDACAAIIANPCPAPRPAHRRSVPPDRDRRARHGVALLERAFASPSRYSRSATECTTRMFAISIRRCKQRTNHRQRGRAASCRG